MGVAGNYRKLLASGPAPRGFANFGVLPASKDQLLCELELQQTRSAEHIRALEIAQHELEESRNAFAAFYQQSPIPYVTLNARGCLIDANLAALDLFGAERHKLEQLPFTFLIQRQELPRFLAHLARCRNAEENKITTEIWLKVRKQEPVYAQLISTPLGSRDQANILTAIVDLTESSRNRQALAETKDFSESIVQTVSQPLVVVDGDLRIISVNRAFTDFFKQPTDYLRGRVLDALLNLWWSGNQLREALQKVLVKDIPLENFPLEIEPRNIGKRVLLLNARKLAQNSRDPAFLLIAMEDVTARREAEVQLRDSNTQLETRVAARTLDLLKSYEQMESFCYSIAHDLRAPLRSMTGFSHLLAEQFGEQLGPQGRDYAERIQQSAGKMDDLIRDLLNYGKLNTKTLSKSPVDLEKVFQEVLAHQEKDIHEKGAKVRKKGMLPTVLGHEATLVAVLSNLISNALKFVAPNIQPRIVVLAEQDARGARLWVIDNGIGIDLENRSRIFGVFQRLHTEHIYPGTGIGLAIVAKGVERMGGNVGVESEPGKGSRFWVDLPMPEEIPPAQKKFMRKSRLSEHAE